MKTIRFIALPTAIADSYRNGGVDSYGRTAERQVSDGGGLPCRHCLADIEAGDEYLVVAHRPFTSVQPYAETGPIFLHAGSCERYRETEDLPEVIETRQQVMLRGYTADERIVYGTGQIVAADELHAAAATILEHPDVAFAHVRSASNGCFQCRIEAAYDDV